MPRVLQGLIVALSLLWVAGDGARAVAHATPFGSFEVTRMYLRVSKTRPNSDDLRMHGEFTLGTGTDGADPSRDGVAIAVGGLAVQLPPEAFGSRRNAAIWTFRQSGPGFGRVRIQRRQGLPWTFIVEAADINLSAVPNPLTVSFAIGDDRGVQNINLIGRDGPKRRTLRLRPVSQQATCGDGQVDEDLEECDPPGEVLCPFQRACDEACHCPPPPVCGNGVLDAGEECDPGVEDDPNDCCTADCNFEPAAHVCRPTGGACDQEELCSGASGVCPADAKRAGECRGAAGVCDVAESCDGSSNDCPLDRFVAAATECRPAVGACDASESCTGAAPSCPADANAPDGTPCLDAMFCNGEERCSGGVCTSGDQPCAPEECIEGEDRCPECGDDVVDAGEACDPPGGTTQCLGGAACGNDCQCPPPDQCGNGQVDVAEGEECDPGPDVPGDCCSRTCRYESAGAECRAAAGVCDLAEMCSGASAECPADAKLTSVCRPAAGDCDVAETCDGQASACPADVFAGSAVRCREAAGDCDAPEQCTGDSPACPIDAKRTDVCRPAAGPCDFPEGCTGEHDDCPADELASAGTECRAAAGVCDLPESCSGSSSECPADVKRTGECRPADGVCDVAESCDGESVACPPNGFASAGTSCRSAVGVCDVAETCSGDAPGCPADLVAGAGQECRGAAGACDVAELCNGQDPACPPDGFVAAGTQCRAAAGACDVAESCTGEGAACPGDQSAADGTSCSDGTFCNGLEQCAGGACAGAAPPCAAEECNEDAGRCRLCGDGFVDAGEGCEPPGEEGGCGTGLECDPTCQCMVPIRVTITSPSNLSLFNDPAVTVEGTSQQAVSVECAGVTALLAPDGTFAADIVLREGRNPVSCVARSASGIAMVDTVQLVVDTTPPQVVVRTPADGALVTNALVDVTGELVDVSSAAVDMVEHEVMVNGVEAAVLNRAFVAPRFLLQPGRNVLRVTSTDPAGNTGATEIAVTLLADVEQRLQELAGNSQKGTVGQPLAEPLAVRLVDRRGNPVPGRSVLFKVTRGDGTVAAFPEQGGEVTAPTDDNGIASVRYTLGTRSGAGNQEVTASVVGVPGPVVFCAAAEGLPPQRIVAVSGGDQTGAVGTNLGVPLITLVTDALGNPVPGVEVLYTVTAGGGALSGGPTFAATTDSDGQTSAVLTLGPTEGIASNVVVASFEGLAESPATFVESTLLPAAEVNTSVSGLVLDNQDDPVPNVTIGIIGTSLTTLTDDQGRFSIPAVPVGSQLLLVDGRTTPLPGTWPILEFEMNIISGRDNTVGMPIRLLPMDVAGAKVVGGPEDVTIQMAGVPGAELTVFANSVRFPDGSRVGTVSFTQVHSDKVPMLAPLGSHFMLAFTVQPPGTQFDPPARISIPNMGSPPGQVVEMFSFDHDIFEFVSVGTASVSPDGSVIVSNPGFGIGKAGWGGCVPPPPPPNCPFNCFDANPCTRDMCVNGNCQWAPNHGATCTDDDKPCTADVCEGATCTHPPIREGMSCEMAGSQCGTCNGGNCQPNSANDGQSCDDMMFCTDMDKCRAGVCKGVQPDPNETSLTLNLGTAIGWLVEAIDLFKELSPCEFSVDPTFEVALRIQSGACCEQTMDRDARAGSGEGTVGLGFGFSDCPIPGLAYKTPDNRAVLGFLGSLGGDLNGTHSSGKDACGMCAASTSVGAGASASISLGTVIGGDEIVSVTVAGGTSFAGSAGCDNDVGTASARWKAATVTIHISLFDFFSFDHEQVVWPGRPFGPISFTCPLPNFCEP